jgi:hypothetical protein
LHSTPAVEPSEEAWTSKINNEQEREKHAVVKGKRSGPTSCQCQTAYTGGVKKQRIALQLREEQSAWILKMMS